MFVFPANNEGYRKRKRTHKACQQCNRRRVSTLKLFFKKQKNSISLTKLCHISFVYRSDVAFPQAVQDASLVKKLILSAVWLLVL